MAPRHERDEPGKARVLIVSQRALRPLPSRALRFEFEDSVCDLDEAELITPARPPIPSAGLRRVSRLLDRALPGASGWLVPAPAQPATRYDLLFVAVESLFDVQLLHPLGPLLRRARTSVCFIDEVWRKGLEGRMGELRLLRGFDHVLVGTGGSAEAVAALSGRPCGYLPPSVDAAALCPHPRSPKRVIDVYSMGRRSEATHGALLDLAEARGWFYLYDTLKATGMPSHRAHRSLLACLLARTRYFLAYPGKVDAPAETGGQQEIGFRYFEGAASGTILLGEAPKSPWWAELFGWPDAIVPLPYGATSVAEALAPLEDDPARSEAIRRRNVRESLLRHDHVYRWAEVLRVAGLPETAAMERRKQALAERAGAIGDAPHGSPARGAASP